MVQTFHSSHISDFTSCEEILSEGMMTFLCPANDTEAAFVTQIGTRAPFLWFCFCSDRMEIIDEGLSLHLVQIFHVADCGVDCLSEKTTDYPISSHLLFFLILPVYFFLWQASWRSSSWTARPHSWRTTACVSSPQLCRKENSASFLGITTLAPWSNSK